MNQGFFAGLPYTVNTLKIWIYVNCVKDFFLFVFIFESCKTVQPPWSIECTEFDPKAELKNLTWQKLYPLHPIKIMVQWKIIKFGEQVTHRLPGPHGFHFHPWWWEGEEGSSERSHGGLTFTLKGGFVKGHMINQDEWEMASHLLCHRIHGTGIFTYMKTKKSTKWMDGKYTIHGWYMMVWVSRW